MQGFQRSTPNKNTITLRPDMCPTMDNQTVNEMTTYFRESLQHHRAMFAQNFTASPQTQLYFLGKNLLGAALYFEVPELQSALRKMMQAASQDAVTQEILKNVNLEIDRVLAII